MTSSEVTMVPVNVSEYAKFCYLIKVMDSVDRTHSLAKDVIDGLRLREGVRSFMDFDWRGVMQYVSPQIQLVFLQDAERYPIDQTFMKFPFAAIVARTAQIVVIDSVFELDLEASDSHPGVEGATNALRTLQAAVQSLGGKRVQDGERIINQLRRVLQLEL